MNLAASAKELDKVQKAPITNAWKAQTPSDSSSSPISHKEDDMKFATPWWSARSNLTRKTQIARASTLQVVKFDNPGM